MLTTLFVIAVVAGMAYYFRADIKKWLDGLTK
jgi:hypothetical protein